jgi:hypothetical protein
VTHDLIWSRTKSSSFPEGSAERRVLIVSAAIAGFVVLLLLVVVPRGGDAAAHLYRTFLVHRGVLLWDNLWFAGQYPLVSYSLFYYLPAAVVGNALLGAIGVVGSALLFASMVLRAFRRVARWPAYWFAAVVGGQLFTGDYPYTLGFAALLATLWALQRGRTRLAVACAALTLGCSPLAFLFLCLALFALLLVSSPPRSRVVIVAVSVGLLAGIELGALLLFPSPGLYYPFTIWRLAIGVPIGLLGCALALRIRDARPLASIFVVWTLATVAAYLIPSPVGHNLLRPATMVFPMMLLVALLAGFKPRWLAYPAVVASFVANIGPYITTVISRDDPAASRSFWVPMLRYVRAHRSANYRLEVVPTINHWEAYYVPTSGYAMARGWYQQLDSSDNPTLNKAGLTPAAYRAWLRSVGVRYVLAARTDPASGATPEARILARGTSGLVRVLAAPSGSVYELPHATPILTGPAPARLTQQSYSRIAGWAVAPGTYLLRIHYTSLWKLRSGSLCIRPGPGGMTKLEIQRPGSFELQAAEGPRALLALIVDRDRAAAVRCTAPVANRRR